MLGLPYILGQMDYLLSNICDETLLLDFVKLTAKNKLAFVLFLSKRRIKPIIDISVLMPIATLTLRLKILLRATL
jgi:hypothetical protein